MQTEHWVPPTKVGSWISGKQEEGTWLVTFQFIVLDHHEERIIRVYEV